MPAVANPTEEVGAIVLTLAASAIGLKRASGTVDPFVTWDPVQGDVTIAAPVGTTGGGGTRRILFPGNVVVSGTFSGTIVAPAGTLTGATLAANVLASSLTSVGTLSSLAVAGAIGAASGVFTGPNLASRGQLSVQATGGDAPRLSFWDATTFRLAISVTGTAITFDAQTNQTWTFGGTGLASFGGAMTIASTLAMGGAVTLAGGVGPGGSNYVGSDGGGGLRLNAGTGHVAVISVGNSDLLTLSPGHHNAVLPTSSAGLVAGDMWRNGTVVNIV